MNSGVYQIVNKRNAKVYIGSSVELRRRRRMHFVALRQGKHENRYLQAAFNAEPEVFSFYIIEFTQDVLRVEQEYLNALFSLKDKCYNLSPTAGNVQGVVRSAETRAKMSAAKRGHAMSSETKAKLSEALKGCVRSAETRAKMSVAKSSQSTETRAKISAAKKGKPRSLETRQKISAALRAKSPR